MPMPQGAEPADQFYGDRLARITDPHNNLWSISTHIEDLTPRPNRPLPLYFRQRLVTETLPVIPH